MLVPMWVKGNIHNLYLGISPPISTPFSCFLRLRRIDVCTGVVKWLLHIHISGLTVRTQMSVYTLFSVLQTRDKNHPFSLFFVQTEVSYCILSEDSPPPPHHHFMIIMLSHIIYRSGPDQILPCDKDSKETLCSGGPSLIIHSTFMC